MRDITRKYYVKKEDLWIQSNSALSPEKYKNKLPLALYQELSNVFNLRIIRIYGAAGQGKGVIDAMSSFAVKDVLCHDIVIQDVFFNTREEICDYLAVKNPSFCCKNISAEVIAKKRGKTKVSNEIPNCMKQHLMVLVINTDIKRKEYVICDITPWRYVTARHACIWNLMNIWNWATKLNKNKPINTTKRNAIMMFTKTVTSKIL